MHKIQKHLVFIVMALLFSACHMSSNLDFKKQKYTKLKPIKVESTKISKVDVEKKTLQIQNKIVAKNISSYMIPVPLDFDPIEDEIKKTLAQGNLIVIEYEKKYYILEEAVFDGIYHSLIGTLVEANPEDYEGSDRLVLHIDKLGKTYKGQEEIWVKNINKYEFKFKKDITAVPDDKEAESIPVEVNIGTNKAKLISAINSGKVIVISQNNRKYVLDEPVFDETKNRLSGLLVSTSAYNLTANNSVIAVVSEYDVVSGNGVSIDLSMISSINAGNVKYYSKSSDKNVGFSNKEAKSFPMMSLTNYQGSNSAQLARKLLIAAGLSILVMLLGVLILVLFWFEFALILMVAGYGLSLIFLIASTFFSRRYKKEAWQSRLNRHEKGDSVSGTAWFLLVLFSIILLGIPLFLALLIVGLGA
jgi:hypothetical protein